VADACARPSSRLKFPAARAKAARRPRRVGVARAERGLQVAAEGAVGDPAQPAEPAAVIEKVGPEPLGQREHDLAVRHVEQQRLIQP
jgi:hypothetical protein